MNHEGHEGREGHEPKNRVLCLVSLVFRARVDTVLVTAAASGQQPIRLVVIVVLDQFRADYLTTFASHWRDGFRTAEDRLSRATRLWNCHVSLGRPARQLRGERPHEGNNNESRANLSDIGLRAREQVGLAVFFDSILKRSQTDSELVSGLLVVACVRAQRCHDGLLLNFGERCWHGLVEGQIERKVLRKDLFVAGNDHGAFDDVFHFADIARPRIPLKNARSLR